jgi:hypothetical protein
MPPLLRQPTPAECDALRRLWPDDTVSRRQIIIRLGVAWRTMQRWARDLGLPARGTNRDLIVLGGRHGATVAAAKFDLSVADQLAKCEAYLARERDPKAPRWVRCECCGGKADATTGHPRCGVAA